ncbi:MAG TPA: phage holin family protein [Steroidobacteraceae bacterium]|nr:phage holin family protein [Steroidobacteraceae bacterium]
MMGLLLRGVFAAAGLWIATFFITGLRFDRPATLIVAGLVLGLVNALLRPLLVILTLPITIVTLGMFLLVINAAMVALVAWLMPGMQVAGFWSALGTAVIVSVVGWVGGALARGR